MYQIVAAVVVVPNFLVPIRTVQWSGGTVVGVVMNTKL